MPSHIDVSRIEFSRLKAPLTNNTTLKVAIEIDPAALAAMLLGPLN